jgi:hypothetical protein
MIASIENIRMILGTNELRFVGATVSPPTVGFSTAPTARDAGFSYSRHRPLSITALPGCDLTDARRPGCHYPPYPRNPQGNERDAKD